MLVADSDLQYRTESVVQLLDDHHVVVLGDQPAERAAFTGALTTSVDAMSETELVSIRGRSATDVAGFTRRLAGALGVPQPPAIASPRAITDTLRRAPRSPKRRYIIWHDADAMLESDLGLFGRVVNGLFTFAAEQEHLSPDMLVVHRVVFTGGPKLGAYAEDTGGQFCRWLEEGCWEVASCVERPSVLTYRLEG